MNEILEAALEVEKFFRARRWKFCIIGGLAVMRWAPPRATEDVDFSLLSDLATSAESSTGSSRTLRRAAPMPPHSRSRAACCSQGVERHGHRRRARSLSIRTEIIARGSKFTFAKGVRLTTASAEDPGPDESHRGSPRDWQDIADIVHVERDRFDWSYLNRQLAGLSEAIDVEPILQRLSSSEASGPSKRPSRRKPGGG